MADESRGNIFVVFLIVAGLIALGVYLITSQIIPNPFSVGSRDWELTTEAEKRQTQYRFGYQVRGDKTQIIALNQGKALFGFKHEGSGRYLVDLRTNDGRLIAVIADGEGNFETLKEIDVPATDAYILSVKARGLWSLDYK